MVKDMKFVKGWYLPDSDTHFEHYIKDGGYQTIHSDRDKKVPGSRHYIHAKDVADGCLFLLQNQNKIDKLDQD